jgi:glycosyltransferase involved in cell wall biosynthesis
VSSDHYRKNHRVLFDAWSNIADAIPEGLVFVGHAIYGSTLTEIQDEVQRRGLSDRFRWLQNVEDSELPAIYRWAQATVAPSLYEGFGMTLIEAMACGSPVIAARNGVYEEVGAEAVITFDGTSASDLSERLARVSAENALRARLTALGFERARRFTWRRTAEATLGVYRRLLQPDEATECRPFAAGERRD